jgi:Ca-activated chloride channel family protein
MSFESPYYLLGLIAIPVVIAAYLYMQRRRKGTASKFASAPLFKNLVDRSPGWRRHLPPAILLLALALMLIGLARPQAALSVSREDATIVLAVDTSRSMSATDVKPSRLVAAKRALRAFLAEVPEKFRVGVVSFASEAQVVAPATHDRALVQRAITLLKPGEGTALGDAIARSVEVGRAVSGPAKGGTAKKPPPTSILVLSDGANQGGRIAPDQAARLARTLGMPVYTVAFGTADGVVTVRHIGGFVERIRVPPDPKALQKIAADTNGKFFAAPTAEELQAVYRDLGSRLGSETKKREVTVAFAGGAVALLLLGGALSTLWFRRLP